MKKLIPILVLAVLIACQQEKDTTFLLSQDQVGKLKRTDLIENLETIYALDSIVKDTARIQLGSQKGKIKIYEKGGLHLLTITPNSDSIPSIENIRIYDPRFMTDKGIGLNSTFKEIKEAYAIRKVVTSLNNVVIFLKNSDLYFTISKEELPSSLRYASSTNIETVQIPDKAKIKYMMVGWE